MNTMTTPETTDVQMRLQAELAAMLPSADLPGSLSQRERDAYETKRRVLDARLRTIRVASEDLADIDNQVWNIARLETEHRDLTAIREEFANELAGPPVPSQMERRHWLHISMQAIDGNFNVMTEAIPLSFPLFQKLTARGYVGPTYAPWNPFASLFGSLPTIKRRLTELRQRRDAAQEKLESALRDSVSV